MPLKTLLITGGSGYLGRHLARTATGSYKLYTTYHTRPDQITAGQPIQMDITDRQAVLNCITALKPEAIIHTAAGNPGVDEQKMMDINANGSLYVAEGAVAVEARLVHISTDVVHNGQKAPYADETPPTPLNIYGRSKAQAEANVANINPKATIVRTSLIYGLDEIDNGTRSFVKRLERGERLDLFSDVIRQPVWIETLTKALLKLSEMRWAGLLNVVGRQVITREEFGRRMLAYWQIDTGDLLGSGRAADVSPTIPRDLRMSIEKGQDLLQMSFLGVDEVLATAPHRNVKS